MVLVRSIIRPEKVENVLKAVSKAGFNAVTKMDVYGRGKQKGLQIGSVFYDELPKDMLLMVVEEEKKDELIEVIMNAARTGENGNSGDGRIFVTPVTEAYTISTKLKDL